MILFLHFTIPFKSLIFLPSAFWKPVEGYGRLWKPMEGNPNKNIYQRKPTVSVKVYGCNHVAIEVDDVEKAIAFYQDVFNLEKLNEGEGDAFFKLGEHQFLAMFEVKEVKPERMRHFGIMVRDEQQLAEVR